ncbi:unnamed protein product [Brassica rapa]|nr:unnamed protein product [Brassica napus]CAG7869808.1 unnamed protein product [Brassica rapa]VDC66491.1 unnamed protein product [Brassica rapa]
MNLVPFNSTACFSLGGKALSFFLMMLKLTEEVTTSFAPSRLLVHVSWASNLQYNVILMKYWTSL